MDFMVGLSLFHGFMVIIVVVDRLTKYAHFGALTSHFNAARSTKLFIDIVVRHHGFPSEIILNPDPIFLSNFWDQLFKFSRTKLKHSTANHP